MRFLRTVSTGRLMGLIAAVVAVVAGGAAIAVAAGSSSPVPPRKSLAQAIHQALTAPAVPGISARITFTNHLIDASNIQGTDPILQGASGRIWYSPAVGLRLELQSDNGDGQVVVNNRSFWIYDPTSRTAYEGTLPARSGAAKDSGKGSKKADSIPSVAQIQSDIDKLAQHISLSGAIPSDVGGRPTYTVRVSPQHDGGLLGRTELAWDAFKGVPLRFAVYARGEPSPVLELKLSNISFSTPSKGDFAIHPPSGAKIVKVSAPAGAASDRPAKAGKKGKHTAVTGVAAVARRLSFKLRAKPNLIGLPRQSVSLLSWGGTPAALVTYGQNLGGIAVIEQPATSTKPVQSSSSGGDQPGLSLPTVVIHGVSGQELDTALGTMIRFTRAGVTYTVIGSVPPAAAEFAARSI